MNCEMVKSGDLEIILDKIAVEVSNPENQPIAMVVFGPECPEKDKIFRQIVSKFGKSSVRSYEGIAPVWSAKRMVSVGQNAFIELSGYASTQHGERHRTVIGLYNNGAKSVIGIYVKLDHIHDSGSQAIELRKHPPTADGLTYLVTVSI